MTIAKNTHRMSTRSKAVQKARAVPVERNIDNGKMPSTVYLMSDIGSSKVTPREQERLDDLEEEMAMSLLDDLEKESLEVTRKQADGRITLGYDYVVVAERPVDSD